nr:DUF6527 family protein [uncultured Mucilaginibacter sp.]
MKVEFVEFIPEILAEQTLYISMKYKSVRHKCACGCGEIVITPITPTDWQLKYDGAGVTLRPSIGNWNFACQSHYWIVGSEVRWCGRWDQKQIEKGREADVERKSQYFKNRSNKSGKSDRHKLLAIFIKLFIEMKHSLFKSTTAN